MKPVNFTRSGEILLCQPKLIANTLHFCHYAYNISACHTYIHTCAQTKSESLAPSVFCHRSLVLSGPSRPPVSQRLRLGARQRGDRALRLHCTPPYTAERHTGWTTEQLAQDHGDGSSLGAMRRGVGWWWWGEMTQRQTGRVDAMSRISNSLTGTASNS